MVCKMQSPIVSEKIDRALCKSHHMHIHTISSVSLENTDYNNSGEPRS